MLDTRRGSFDVAALPLEIPDRLRSDVDECAHALAVSPSSLVLAAFAVTLGRMHSRESVRIAVALPPSHGGASVPFARSGRLVPTEIDIGGRLHPCTLIRAVDQTLRRLERRRLPGIEGEGVIVDAESCTASFEVSSGSSVPAAAGNPDPADPLRADEIGAPTIAMRFVVDAVVGTGTGLLYGAEPRGGADALTAVLARFLAALGDLAAMVLRSDPHDCVADVRAISAADRDLLARLNATSRSVPSISLGELVRGVARDSPHDTAVRDAQHVLTYAELVTAGTAESARLRAAGVRAGDTVLVAVPRSVAEVVAVLAVVGAGAAYVGIDTAQPRAHLAKIIERAGPALAIASSEDSRVLGELGVSVVAPWQPDLQDALDPDECRTGESDRAHDPDQLAYIAFTSGSTGEAKGVAVPHRAVVRLVHDARHLGLGPGKRVLRMAPLAFDASTFEIWGALVAGASLEVCPSGPMGPDELGTFLQERQITVAWLTAGLFRLVEQFAGEKLGCLERLLTGGDVVPHESVRSALQRHPGLVITNGYGPTENTTFTTTYSVADPSTVTGPIPIGIPVPGTRVFVLDADGRLLPPGAVGELYTAGLGLALGYVGDDAETARCFGHLSPDVPERLYRTGDLVRIDESGLIHFLGRVDDQVKVRGHRVQLEGIRGALRSIGGVADAEVFAVDTASGDKRVVAALCLDPGSGLDPMIIRRQLMAEQPEHMVPHLWTVVTQMPVTVNGKLDKERLIAGARPASAFST